MELINRARVYFGKLFQINISRDLGRELETRKWNNGADVYSVYDPETDAIIITRNRVRAAELSLKVARFLEMETPRGCFEPSLYDITENWVING